MKPPFLGTKVLDTVGLADIVALINRDVLFASRWQFRKGQTAAEWEELKKTTLVPLFEKLVTVCESQNLISPKIVYGHFECKKQENAILVSKNGKKIYRFEFPRQRQSPNLCVSDFFPDGFITMQIATIGKKVIEEGVRLFKEKRYSEAFFLKGLAAECAEAAAEYGQRVIGKGLGLPEDLGCRFSFGYPAAPSLMDQEKLYALLEGSRIGVKLTETFYLVPEYSTSAIVSFDPKARQFKP